MANEPQIVAITDYRPEDYARVYALAPNGGGMEKRFDEWKHKADAVAAEYRSRGFDVIRVLVDPDEFAAWLAARNVQSTDKTRAEFGHHLASKKMAD